MLAKKKKLSKKEIKEDKLVTSFFEARTFYEKNQTLLFSAVGIIAVIIVAVLFFTSRSQENNQLASAELVRIVNVYNSGLYQQAIDGKEGTKEIGLLKIVDLYGGTKQGELARIYLANAYFYTGQYDKAIEEFDDYSGDDDIMVASAIAGKAGCYEVKGEFEEAAKSFSKAANVSYYVPANPDYLLNAGINYIKVKNNSEAKIVLEKVKNDYSASAASKQVDKYISLLKN